jgi:alpha-beta hydrolase superfamily lysophospholipase
MTMKRIISALVAGLGLALALAGASFAADPSGDWLGAITAGPGLTFHEAFHISKAPQGGYSGTLDSLDRAVFGIPLGDITANADSLSFTVATHPAAIYTAKWDAASGQWAGRWTQSGQTFPLTLARGFATPKPVVSGLDGVWEGVLGVGAIPLHLTLHVRTGAGGTAAWLDSPDQLVYGLAVDSIQRDGASVHFALTAPLASFAGVWSADQQSLAGQWTQGGNAAPLRFTRRPPGAQPAASLRPQTPVKPYPYREQQVAFDNVAAHARLAGTLTLPPGDGPFPAVVLVAGSGPNTRDEPIFGHQIFLVLADHLTRQGIAVLRYDKRGTGQSTGDYAKATTMDFAADVEAAMAFLRSRKDIDPRHVGLIGHSEGGLIVPIVAARDPQTAFIVMMAGPGVDGADVWMEQLRLILKAAGVPDVQIAIASAQRREQIAIIRAERDPEKAAAQLRALAPPELPKAAVDAAIAQVNTDWFREFFDYDPAPTLRQVRCPVLALDGAKDLQVSAAQNLPAIRAALVNNPDAEIEELPGLNHLFQTANTGGIAEYAQIEQTIAPSVMDTITNWILKHVGAH